MGTVFAHKTRGRKRPRPARGASMSPGAPSDEMEGQMKALIVEDDPTSRLILQRLLLPYGQADLAVDGREGINAFKSAHELGVRYDLVCLDIMLPEMDGQTVLKALRAMEAEKGVKPGQGSRVIMTTALNDKDNLLAAIQQCDAYLVKPIDKSQLMFYLKRFGFIK